MTNTNTTDSIFKQLDADSDPLDRYEAAETAWYADPEVKAAIRLLKAKQLEYQHKAGLKDEDVQFWDDMREHFLDTDTDDLSVYQVLMYNE